MTRQDLLTERYGAPSPARRRLVLVPVGVLVVAFLGWLVWTALSHAEPEVRSDLSTYRVVDQHTATAEVLVVVRDADVTEPSCLLRAFAEDHTIVGEARFTPTFGTRRYSEEIRTERLATSVQLVGCTTPSQPRAR